jgi:hypothetical protein
MQMARYFFVSESDELTTQHHEEDGLSKTLRKRLSREDAEQIARVLIAEATAGNLKAIEMIWDRLEGKPVGRQEQGGPGDFHMPV